MRQAVTLVEESDELSDDPTLLAWAAVGPLFLREAGAGRVLIGRAFDFSARPGRHRGAALPSQPHRHR